MTSFSFRSLLLFLSTSLLSLCNETQFSLSEFACWLPLVSPCIRELFLLQFRHHGDVRCPLYIQTRGKVPTFTGLIVVLSLFVDHLVVQVDYGN